MLLQHLSAGQRLEARNSVEKLVELGISDAHVKDLAVQLGVATSEVSVAWRNIRYGTDSDRRLDVWEDTSFSQKVGSVSFGSRLNVVNTEVMGDEVWLKLGAGPFRDKYVLAQTDDSVNCIEMGRWATAAGQVPNTAFHAQEYPDKGMYSEGYPGSQDFCLISASGDAFWREVNVEMLFRDIATATVFEEQWGGNERFTDWVAYYAANVVIYGDVLGACPKRFIVTVRPTSRWRNYRRGCCLGPEIGTVKDDIGRAQANECTWVYANRDKLRIAWERVEFITAFDFLRTYCKWTDDDCMRAAESKLCDVLQKWKSLNAEQRAHELQSAVWSVDEAFHGQQVSSQVRESLCQLLLHTYGCDLDQDVLTCAWQIACPEPDRVRATVTTGVSNHHAALHALVRLAEAKLPFSEALSQQLHSLPTSIYVVGGFGEGDRSLATVERLTPVLGRWEELPPMATPRAHLAAVATGGYVYVLGGVNPEKGQGWHSFHEDMFRFNPKGGAWEVLPPMPTKRSLLAAAALEGKIYALGGSRVGGPVLPTAECYDSVLQTWTTLAPMPTGKAGLAAAAMGGRVYALGGHSGGHRLDAAERLDPALGTWEVLPAMPTARAGLAAAALGGRVYALGGYHGGSLATLERYDPLLRTWEALPPMGVPRASLAAAAANGRIYALGGERGGPLSVAEAYDPIRNSWETLPSPPSSRSNFAAVACHYCNAGPRRSLIDNHMMTTSCEVCTLS